MESEYEILTTKELCYALHFHRPRFTRCSGRARFRAFASATNGDSDGMRRALDRG